MKTETQKKSKAKAVIKGTIKYFLKLVVSLIVLVALLSFFSMLFHVDLTDKINEWLELREIALQEGGFVSIMLNWKMLGAIFIIPNLFFWGYEIHSEYNRGSSI